MPTLILIAWFTPMLCAVMILVGVLRARYAARRSPIVGPRLLIIQITTVGNEGTVNEIIRRIRGFQLTIPFSIWIVTEPGVEASYQGHDELIVVPEDFHCRASYKARALEYSRRLRVERRLNDFFVKVLFVDDDGVPTKSYIEKVFRSEFDVCEGIPAPRNGYGRFLSHMDDLRTINCIYMCSVFQGIGHPIHVHGEGLCVRGTAESSVTWDYQMFASEDLVFGHMAVLKGRTWGFVWDYMEITSPFTWRDFLTQRRRWLWGNIHAVRHVLPLRSSILLVTLYSYGLLTFVLSTIGIVFALTGALSVPSSIMPWLLVSTVLWFSLFALSGWINSGGGASRGIRRVRDVIVAALLAFVTSAVAIGVQVVALLKGNPHRFEVIQKTDPKAKKRSLATSLHHGSSTGPEHPVLTPEPVVLIPEPVESLADFSGNAVDGK
jgi:Glycosyl transferase family group 2